MAYATPGAMNTSVDVFTWVNSVTDNWFFPMIIIAVFIIIFVKMLFNENNTASKAFSAASFMVMIIAVFSRVLNFVSTGFMSIFIIMTAVGAIWMQVENRG